MKMLKWMSGSILKGMKKDNRRDKLEIAPVEDKRRENNLSTLVMYIESL